MKKKNINNDSGQLLNKYFELAQRQPDILSGHDIDKLLSGDVQHANHLPSSSYKVIIASSITGCLLVLAAYWIYSGHTAKVASLSVTRQELPIAFGPVNPANQQARITQSKSRVVGKKQYIKPGITKKTVSVEVIQDQQRLSTSKSLRPVKADSVDYILPDFSKWTAEDRGLKGPKRAFTGIKIRPEKILFFSKQQLAKYNIYTCHSGIFLDYDVNQVLINKSHVFMNPELVYRKKTPYSDLITEANGVNFRIVSSFNDSNDIRMYALPSDDNATESYIAQKEKAGTMFKTLIANINTLIPVRVKNPGDTAANNYYGSDVIIWFYPTKEFFDLLPDPFAKQLKAQYKEKLEELGIDSVAVPGKQTSLKAGISNVLVYPNPGYNEVNLTFESTEESRASIYLADVFGRVAKVLNPSASIQKGENKFNFDLRNITPGLYLIAIQDKNGHLITRRILKR